MGSLIVLETNALIYWSEGRLPLPSGNEELCTSIVSKIEFLSFPALEQEEEETLREILGQVQVIPLDAGIAEQAILLRRSRLAGFADSVVAATAMEYRAPLWTYDQGFTRIPDLVLHNPPLLPSEY